MSEDALARRLYNAYRDHRVACEGPKYDVPEEWPDLPRYKQERFEAIADEARIIVHGALK